MKIFEIRFATENEKAWVYAQTNIDAIKTYCSVTSTGLYDFDEVDEVLELPKEKWSEFTVYDDESESEDSNKMTFEQWVEENKDSGSDVIAVTLQ
jgi:hypothetical protein